VQIIKGATAIDFDSVQLPAGDVSATTDLIQIPRRSPPGTYYLGTVIDFDEKIAELDETNNALGSTAVTIAASSLRITTLRAARRR